MTSFHPQSPSLIVQCLHRLRFSLLYSLLYPQLPLLFFIHDFLSRPCMKKSSGSCGSWSEHYQVRSCPDADDVSLIFNLSLTIDLAHRTSTNLTFLRWSHPCYCKPLLTVQNCAELSRDFETWNLKRTKQKEETKFSSKFIVKKESWFSFVEVKKMIIYPQLRCGRLFIVKRHTCSNSIRRMHNVLLGVG